MVHAHTHVDVHVDAAFMLATWTSTLNHLPYA